MTCPDGWVAIKQTKTCIKLFHESKTWLRARATCKSIGADLVNIVNADMNHFISGKIAIFIGVFWLELNNCCYFLILLLCCLLINEHEFLPRIIFFIQNLVRKMAEIYFCI